MIRQLELQDVLCSSQIITTNKPTTKRFTGRSPSCRSPNEQCKGSKEGIISHSKDLFIPSSPGVFQLCLWPLRAPGYLGEDYHVSHQPSDASTLTSWRLQQHEESGSTRLTYSRSRLHEISVVRRCVCRPEWEFRTRCQRLTTSTTAVHTETSAVLRHTTKRQQNNNNTSSNSSSSPFSLINFPTVLFSLIQAKTAL